VTPRPLPPALIRPTGPAHIFPCSLLAARWLALVPRHAPPALRSYRSCPPTARTGCRPPSQATVRRPPPPTPAPTPPRPGSPPPLSPATLPAALTPPAPTAPCLSTSPPPAPATPATPTRSRPAPPSPRFLAARTLRTLTGQSRARSRPA